MIISNTQGNILQRIKEQQQILDPQLVIFFTLSDVEVKRIIQRPVQCRHLSKERYKMRRLSVATSEVLMINLQVQF
jgi:hypothetical protein